MARLITLNDSRKPESSVDVKNWTPGGVVAVTNTEASHIVGEYTSSNGYTSGENINCYRVGNVYTSSDGFIGRVTTKTTSLFHSHHFIGSASNSNLSGSNLVGSSLIGAGVYNNARSCWIKNVKGFVCEISDAPYPQDGSAQADSSGGCETFRISGVFADNNGKIRIYDMTQGGTKIFGHTWNTRPSNRNWHKMCYYCNSNEMLNMYHLGWVIAFTHKKYAGGNNVQKYCTGRVRYLQPLVSGANGALYWGATEKNHIVAASRRWDEVSKYPFYTV